MPSFRFEGRDKSGATISGEVEAATEREAVKQLQSQGVFLRRLQKQKAGYESTSISAGLWRGVLEPVLWPVGSKALSLYFQSFASMIAAGMGIHEATKNLSQRASSRTLRRASADMVEATIHGEPIATVAPRYPAAFQPFAIAMLKAGDASGMLENAMRRMAEYYQRSHELEGLARFETFYTKLLIIALLLVPSLPTLVLGGFNTWLSQIIPTLVRVALGFIIVWYGWRLLMRARWLRLGVDRIKLSLPWIGSIVRRGAVAKWCRAMAMLSNAGVAPHQALVAAGAASGNSAIARSTTALADRVLAGDPISAVMAASGDFPDQAVDIMAIGERTGSIDASLDKVAEYYESETQTAGKQGVMLGALLAYGVVMAIMAYIIISGWTGSGYIAGIKELAAPDAGLK